MIQEFDEFQKVVQLNGGKNKSFLEIPNKELIIFGNGS